MSADHDQNAGEEDFAALLAEYEQSAPQVHRSLNVGDVVEGTVISIGDDAVFVEMGYKSEGMLEREQVTDSKGELIVEIGSKIEARVVDTGAKTGCVVLRRSVGKGPDARDELAQAFEHGMPVEGVITGTNKGGVEVQIAGVRAFCPMSQLDNRFVEDPESFVGQRSSFRITRFEPGRGSNVNIVVSRRAILEEEARELAAETRTRLKPGAVFTGTVSSIQPYGAFVDIGGIEGLVHVSELGFARVSHPGDVLREGQTLDVQVIGVEQTGDPKRPEKIKLSVKSMEKDPWAEVEAQFAAGSKVQGTVVRLQPFGAFVELAPGIEGLIHISEMVADRRINHPREVVKEGQAVTVTVLNVDSAQRRISLTLKDLGAEAARQAEERNTIAEHKRKQPESLGTFGDLLKNKLK